MPGKDRPAARTAQPARECLDGSTLDGSTLDGSTLDGSTLDGSTPVSDLTVDELFALVRGAMADAASAVAPARPPSPYDRLTPEEAWTELRIGKTTYNKLIRANVLRQLRDETAGVVFVTRAELDRYKRETGSRPGPISNLGRSRPSRAA